MSPDTPTWTPDQGCDSPFGLAMRLYQDGWVQLLGAQQAWLNSLAEWQQQVMGSPWPPPGPWPSWPIWHDGTEQLA